MIGNVQKGNEGEAIFAQLEGSAADACKAPLHVCCRAIVHHWGGKAGKQPCKPVLQADMESAETTWFTYRSWQPSCNGIGGTPDRERDGISPSGTPHSQEA